ncbi:hypothetical protein MNBD_UNCLBAC01-1485 [hydrothermal vent metagenome]|uniref:DUF1844 domain-containing protein n=1 Tax=hydrothermal vent metagenome TaxID=652676 RepID=A0A3B1E4Y1_9ZZZZ
MKVTFLNYIKSIVMQAMIFLGVSPSPVTSKMEVNLNQAKLLLNTLILLQEKTDGNLTPQESEVLRNAVDELQVKYDEVLRLEEEFGG